MSLIIFNRSLKKVNALWLINQGRLLNSGNYKAIANVIPSKLPLLSASFQQLNVKPFSQTVISYSTDVKGHNHACLWTIERAVSLTLLGLIPAAYSCPCSFMNYVLALALIAHAHWGAETVIIDYIRPSIFGQIIPKVAVTMWSVISAFALGGLFYFNYSDVGLIKAIKMYWAL